jgi:hypothetical protein
MEDLGFYLANYSAAQCMSWGHFQARIWIVFVLPERHTLYWRSGMYVYSTSCIAACMFTLHLEACVQRCLYACACACACACASRAVVSSPRAAPPSPTISSPGPHALTAYCSIPTTTHHSPLTTRHSLLTTHHSLLTARYSPLTTHCSLLTTHHSPLTTHHSRGAGQPVPARGAPRLRIGRCPGHGATRPRGVLASARAGTLPSQQRIAA